MQQKPTDNRKYNPGPDLHVKHDSASGGLADWGPLLAMFATGFKGLWHLIKKYIFRRA